MVDVLDNIVLEKQEAMLPGFIIKEIKDQEDRERQKRSRRPYAPPPVDPGYVPGEEQSDDEDDNRGVWEEDICPGDGSTKVDYTI